MKSGWQYVNDNGTTVKMAPKTLVENVKMSENGPSLKEVMPSNPNLLINGDFQVWQRGTSFTYASDSIAYTADRWYTIQVGGVSRLSAAKNGRVMFGLRTYCSSTGSTVLAQPFEDVQFFRGQIYTVSFYYDCSSGVTVTVCLGGTLLGTVAGSGFATFTGVWGASDAVYAQGLTFYGGTHPNTSYFDLYQVKLEYGTIVTPESPRLYGEELVLCQRYYLANIFISGLNFLDNGLYWLWPTNLLFPSTMRITPTIITVSLNGNTPVGQNIDNHGLARILTARSGASYIDWTVNFDAEIY